MPEIMSLAMFEQRGQMLLTQRKAGHPPFGGLWLLPGVMVDEDESAEEALERHVLKDLGALVQEQEFVETLYLEDETTRERYVANVFRIARHEGELRLRVAGDYEDARWVKRDELANAAMPAALRQWLTSDRRPAPAGPAPVPPVGPAPDNRAAWNTIARAYQERYQISTERLTFGPRVALDDELLGDVAGLRAIVLGCGGGQDCIVLAKRGAQVIGIDLSDRQIEYGRRLAEREGVEVTLLQGNVEHLKGIEDESQDLALSLHALNYVERVDRAFAEAFRVLRPDAPFVFSVHHPFDACLEDTPPYGVVKGYWEREQDWQWDFPEARASARLRSWYRPVSEWVALLTEAGFRIDRLLEPPPVEGESTPWDASYRPEKLRLVPATLIIRAVKP